MSYIEKKYREEIYQTFYELEKLDKMVRELLNRKSVKIVDQIAKLCAESNKKINLILKKYYPEIKELNDKLKIKSSLNFYFDLIENLTDFVKNVENLQKMDEKYFESLIHFIDNKTSLISGKYAQICAQELTTFYDNRSRENLEEILAAKLEKKSREFFMFGSLEEEIKKVASTAGANQVVIKPIDKLNKAEFESARSVISFTTSSNDEENKLIQIGNEIKKYLESKRYRAVLKSDMIITDAKLLPDDNLKSNELA